MKPFLELDEEVLLAALEGQECILDQIAQPGRQAVERSVCPECGARPTPLVDPHRPLHSYLPTFNYIASCPDCECQFDPQSGLIRKPGGFSPIIT
jgi:hypothetical protein